MNKNQTTEKALAAAKELFSQRLEIVRMTPEKALDTILCAEKPVPLVHSFPEEDFHFLIHRIGIYDSLPLLSFASNKQIQYIFDIEIWEKDRINTSALIEWMENFYLSDPIRMAKHLINTQKILTEFYLSKNIELKIREHDQDPSDFGDGFFSFDNVFYVKIINKSENDSQNSQMETVIEQLLAHMAQIDYDEYVNMIMESTSFIDAEFEEESYRLKNIRLAEKGFLPFEEAVGIYQPLSPEGLAKRSRKVYSETAAPSFISLPLYITDNIVSQTKFTDSLTLINSDELKTKIQAEFARLCNTIAAADSKIIREKEEILQIVKKAAGYLSIGLEILNSGNNSSVIAKYPLSDIFRIGYGAALQLKWEAQRWYKKSWSAKNKFPLSFWGEQWFGVLGGLLIRRPLFFDNCRTGGNFYKEFETLEQINSSRKTFEQIKSFDFLLSKFDPDIINSAEKNFNTYKRVILTLWARHYLEIEETFTPIPIPQFKEFFKQLWENRAIPDKIKKNFLNWISSKINIPDYQVSDIAGSALENLFREIESEYSMVSAQDIDPRFINLFFITK